MPHLGEDSLLLGKSENSSVILMRNVLFWLGWEEVMVDKPASWYLLEKEGHGCKAWKKYR